MQELLKKTETNNLKILSQNYSDGKNIDINEYENIMVELNESILVKRQSKSKYGGIFPISNGMCNLATLS